MTRGQEVQTGHRRADPPGAPAGHPTPTAGLWGHRFPVERGFGRSLAPGTLGFSGRRLPHVAWGLRVPVCPPRALPGQHTWEAGRHICKPLQLPDGHSAGRTPAPHTAVRRGWGAGCPRSCLEGEVTTSFLNPLCRDSKEQRARTLVSPRPPGQNEGSTPVLCAPPAYLAGGCAQVG